MSVQQFGGSLQPVDKSPVDKIQILVGEGVKTVGEMKRHLRHYLRNDLFAGMTPSPITNRRYHQKDVDIRNHMYKATVKQMLFKVDQENLKKKIKQWRQENSEDLFFFRPCSIGPQKCMWRNIWCRYTCRCKRHTKPSLCSSNCLAEVLDQPLWQWNHACRCHLQDNAVWASSLLSCGEDKCQLCSGGLLCHTKWNNNLHQRSSSHVPWLESYVATKVLHDRLLLWGN